MLLKEPSNIVAPEMSHHHSSSSFRSGAEAQHYELLRRRCLSPAHYSESVNRLDSYFQCCCAFWHWMNCYDRRLRRTVPVRGSSSNELVSPPQRSRVNGWSLPLHSFQFIAWVVYSYMAIVGFGIYIPLLPYNWKYAGYSVIGVAFVFHFVTHLVAVSIDPADPSIRAKKNYSNPMPVLDKRKHPHVIQNLHCYLCEVDVGPKVKHCSSCNKCISDFDHHCKWLNNCVGGRNYWFFFLTVVSAVFGVLLLVFVILFIFIEHFLNPAELRTAPQFNNIAENSTWLAFLPVAPIETSSVGILVVAFITFMLGVASLLLLGHLLGFHIYLLMKKMSTYEYIVKQRHTQSIRDQNIGATQSTTASGTSLENLPPVESAVDCDAPLSGRASALKYQDKVQVASRLSNGICTEVVSKVVQETVFITAQSLLLSHYQQAWEVKTSQIQLGSGNLQVRTK
ncbi:palmitoyltransferase ZDHHC11 isoform X2 [Lepisosteus oculatus]|uniref:palmitoyltransferase ZDHHC11 isoform X2 n=1 Tax=Lepisosteus oculatus TaxID=7918 RepID=UPI0035F51495